MKIHYELYRHFFTSYLFIEKYPGIAIISIRDSKQISIPIVADPGSGTGNYQEIPDYLQGLFDSLSAKGGSVSSHKKLSDRGTMRGKMNDSILVREIRRMIEEARSAVAATVNAGLTMLYWRIGRRINEEVLKGERANYGEEIVSTLSGQLTREYGNGFSYSALTRMAKFAEAFPDPKIVATLSQTLSWSHFRELLPLDRPLQRNFYTEICRLLELNQSGIHVAEYLTVLPPRKILQDKLHKAIEQSRLRLSGGRNE